MGFHASKETDFTASLIVITKLVKTGMKRWVEKGGIRGWIDRVLRRYIERVFSGCGERLQRVYTGSQPVNE